MYTDSPPATSPGCAANPYTPEVHKFAARVWSPLAGESVYIAGDVDQRIAALAAAQHGHVSRRQLLSAGLTSRQIGFRLRRGRLHRVAPGVYAVGHGAPQSLGAEVTALLGAPPGALLSHLTAARLWRIHGHDRGNGYRADNTNDHGNGNRGAPRLPVDILIPSACGQRRTGVTVHRTILPRRIQPAYVQGLPVTEVEQTLLDIAGLLSGRELERALDEALARGLTSRSALTEVARRAGPSPGTALLGILLSRRGPLSLTRSQAEERFLALIRDAGLPMPRTNVRLCGYSVDFYWPNARMVVEIDGYQWHASRSAFERDRRKDTALRAAGLELQRVTWEQMQHDALASIARVAAELALRGCPHGPPHLVEPRA